MNRYLKAATLLSVIYSPVAFSEDCGEAPSAPDVPKGKKASVQDMLDTKSAISQFQTEAKSFRSCLNSQIEALAFNAKAGDEVSEEAKMKTAQLLDTFNKSVDTEEKLAGDFNKAIRAFKKAEAKRKK